MNNVFIVVGIVTLGVAFCADTDREQRRRNSITP
jgi:hypothetical protein